MNLSAQKQRADICSNRQDAVKGDQDISVFGIEDSMIEQSLRCSLQLSQSNNLRLAAAAQKHSVSKFHYQNMQINRLSPPKNEHRLNNLGNPNPKFSSLMASPLETNKNKYNMLEKISDFKVSSADHSLILNKNKDLIEDENLIKLVSEHLIQSIQFLQKSQKRQNHLSATYIETEGEDVPDENIEVNAIKSDIVGPNLLGQKNETTDMDKVRYFQQNFTQMWFQQNKQLQLNQQQSKVSSLNLSNSDIEDQQSLQQSQSTTNFQNLLFKRVSDTPMLTRNQSGSKKQSYLEESKAHSQQISNSFSEDDDEEENNDDYDLITNSIQINDDSIKDLSNQKFSTPDLRIENLKIKSLKILKEQQLKNDVETMKIFMKANNMISSSNEKQKITNNQSLTFIAEQNSNLSSKSMNNSPPFNLISPYNKSNSLQVPNFNEFKELSGSIGEELSNRQQQQQQQNQQQQQSNKQMKFLNIADDNQASQQLSSLMQSRMNSTKKRSILSVQSHINNNESQNRGISHGVRFDQNVEFFDSNLDLLKQHQTESMNQSPLPQEQRTKLLPQSSNLRAFSTNNLKNKNNSPLIQQIPSFTDQRCPEIKNQNIIQEGWLLKKSTNNLVNTYQNKAVKNPKKLHLKIIEMKKLLKLKEINQGDAAKWYRNLQQVISYYQNQEKVAAINGESKKNNYKRDLITEYDLEQIAQTGDLIMFQNDLDKPKNSQVPNSHEMGMLINFNNNDLRVFYLDQNNTITLNHWDKFIVDNDIYNSLIFRKVEMRDRSEILPYIYESVRQHLNDNYKKKLKDTLSNSQDNSKTFPIIQRNSQLVASIYQKAGLIKSSKNITKFTNESFRQKKQLKLQKNGNLSNEITVMLKRHIFYASDNSDMD